MVFTRFYLMLSCDRVRVVCVFFFFKQKTAYEMRISDWSSDVCSSDLRGGGAQPGQPRARSARLRRLLPVRGRPGGGGGASLRRAARDLPQRPLDRKSVV